MSKSIKNQAAILSKLGIEALNEMQTEAQHAIHSNNESVILSPTGTGKTLAFLLPVFAELDASIPTIQALIITPSRELAIQIDQVAREMGTGHKINLVYGGGQSFTKDKAQLQHPPAVLIGTPGRVADHLRRGTFDVDTITTLVLDEFDKSLEVGFEEEMSEIIEALPNLQKRILTSATQDMAIPAFVGMDNPTYVNFLSDEIKKLSLKLILSPKKDKLETLVQSLAHLGNQPGIVFLNFKDSIQRVSDYLTENGVLHGYFYGGMEQHDRERALIKFRNGTHQILLATDLAARGIDIPEIKYIIHYHLPNRAQEFTHRNGRTARMNQEGTAYVLKWENEELPDFIETTEVENLEDKPLPNPSEWCTLLISGGRQDKISKGDIAGLFFKQGKLAKDDLGLIELKQDCAFAAVKKKKVKQLLKLIDNVRLKRKKVRVTVV